MKVRLKTDLLCNYLEYSQLYYCNNIVTYLNVLLKNIKLIIIHVKLLKF
jgi:hypothetical protein